MILSNYESMLAEKGFDDLAIADKKALIQFIANKDGKLQYEVNPQYLLDYHKQLKIDIISEKCEEKIIAGFIATNGFRYRTNRDDQINMIGKKDQLSSDLSITTVKWKTEDEGYINHTKDEWLGVYSEAFTHKETQLMNYNDLKQQILSATTHAEIVKIDWV